MIRFSEKQLLFITGGAAGLIAVVLLILGIFVFRKNLAQAEKDLVAVDGQIKTANDDIKAMEKLKEEIAGLKEQQSEFRKKLPSKDEVSFEKFIETLSAISSDADVKLLNASPVKQSGGLPGAAQVAGSFEKISYSLQIEGEFFNVINFVYLLEEYPRFIKVDRFVLTPKNIAKGLATGKVEHNMAIKITTYVYTAP